MAEAEAVVDWISQSGSCQLRGTDGQSCRKESPVRNPLHLSHIDSQTLTPSKG
jgi:hypothetical protein